jgi:hypothetical protein
MRMPIIVDMLSKTTEVAVGKRALIVYLSTNKDVVE